MKHSLVPLHWDTSKILFKCVTATKIMELHLHYIIENRKKFLKNTFWIDLHMYLGRVVVDHVFEKHRIQ